jgi:peptide/nickel transport system substrate-binding protein
MSTPWLGASTVARVRCGRASRSKDVVMVERVGRSRDRSTRAAWVGLSLLLAIGLVACGADGGSQADQPGRLTTTTQVMIPNQQGGVTGGPADTEVTDGGRIRYGLEAEPEGLDPTRFAFSQAGHAVASAVFDPLATLDADGKAVPYLAKKIEPNADFTVWTLTLPSDVTFHDGTALTAAVVVQNLEAYRASVITGPPIHEIITRVAEIDPTHVAITLRLPYRNFPAALTTQIGYMVAPAMLADPSLAKKPIGTGPFIFDHHKDNDSWSLRKNPSYWKAGLPHLDSIEFAPVPDDAKRAEQLRSGTLDMMQTISGSDIIELRKSDFKRVENRNGDIAFLTLNTTKPPFDNLTARKAVAYATDSAKIRKEVYGDVARPANSPYGTGKLGHLDTNGFPTFDPVKAKQLVDQYKAETGADLSFTFITSADITNAQGAQLLIPGFEAAGMKVTIKQLPQIQGIAQIAAGNYQMGQFRLFSHPSPEVDSTFYRSNSLAENISLNFPRFATPEIDRLTEHAAGSGSPQEQDADYQKVSRILAEQVPYVWLAELDWMLAANPRVNGVRAAANGTLPTIGPKTWIAGLSISQGGAATTTTR